MCERGHLGSPAVGEGGQPVPGGMYAFVGNVDGGMYQEIGVDMSGRHAVDNAAE